MGSTSFPTARKGSLSSGGIRYSRKYRIFLDAERRATASEERATEPSLPGQDIHRAGA